MNLVNPKVEIILEPDPLTRIELCGRVCYKSEDRITEASARTFVESLIRRGHTSVLEHSRITVPSEIAHAFVGKSLPYGGNKRIKNWSMLSGMPAYSRMNARDFMFFGGTIDQLATLENATDYMTVRFVCDRAIANELVRHRVFSFSQESTRYCNYSGCVNFVRPLPFKWAELDMRNPIGDAFTYACAYAETTYRRMLEAGATPQEARDILPLATKTELIMTGTYSQWEEMLKLRLDRAAHPQMRYLMELLTHDKNFPPEIEVRKDEQ